MDQPQLKKNSRVVVERSVIPNATSFIGWTGVVSWVDKRSAGVKLDRHPDQEPIMFFIRELRLDS